MIQFQKKTLTTTTLLQKIERPLCAIAICERLENIGQHTRSAKNRRKKKRHFLCSERRTRRRRKNERVRDRREPHPYRSQGQRNCFRRFLTLFDKPVSTRDNFIDSRRFCHFFFSDGGCGFLDAILF
jgi:uncharacterized protein YlaI